MALIKRLSPAEAGEKKAKPSPRARLNLSLPDEPNEPSDDLKDFSQLYYGAKGIGKTTVAAQFPGAFFLELEPGAKALRVKSVRVPDWEHFVGYVDLLVQEKDPERTIVVDVVDLAYDYAYDFVCKQQKIESPRDENDFGHTWRKIRKMFRTEIQRIIDLPGGCIFLSHDVEKEIQLRDGEKVDRIQPTMSKQALGEVEGIVDVVGNYAYEGEQRYLYIKGSQTMVAKSRLNYNFLVKGGEPFTPGDYVKRIHMGGSPKEAYDNLVRAFRNEQETVDGAPKKAPVKPKLLKLKKN